MARYDDGNDGDDKHNNARSYENNNDVTDGVVKVDGVVVLKDAEVTVGVVVMADVAVADQTRRYSISN